MARKGQSKAFLKEIRRKAGIGEFSKKAKSSKARRSRRRVRRSSSLFSAGVGSNFGLI